MRIAALDRLRNYKPIALWIRPLRIEIVLRRPWACRCGQRNCQRHAIPGPPSWNLYHPVTSRLDDVIEDLAKAVYHPPVGTNWQWVEDKLDQISAYTNTLQKEVLEKKQ